MRIEEGRVACGNEFMLLFYIYDMLYKEVKFLNGRGEKGRCPKQDLFGFVC